MLNKVMLIGNLGRDPEVRTTQAGDKIVNMALATTEKWKDKTSGEMREKTEWHKVVVFNDRLADLAEKFLNKGSKIYIEGQLQTRKYVDQQGVERYMTEIVIGRFNGAINFLGGKRREGQQQPQAAPTDQPSDIVVDDDIPF